jgi:hypothetical protein
MSGDSAEDLSPEIREKIAECDPALAHADDLPEETSVVVESPELASPEGTDLFGEDAAAEQPSFAPGPTSPRSDVLAAEYCEAIGAAQSVAEINRLIEECDKRTDMRILHKGFVSRAAVKRQTEIREGRGERSNRAGE